MVFWRDLSIRRKILVAYALPFFAIWAVAQFVFAQMSNINDTAMTANSAQTAEHGLNWELLLVLMGPALLTACMGLLMLRSVANPLGRAAELLSRLSAGDLDVVGTDLERGDEIGALARSLRVFKEEAMRTATLLAAEREMRRVTTAHLARLTEQVSDFENQITGVQNILAATAVQLQAMAAQRAGKVAPDSSGDRL